MYEPIQDHRDLDKLHVGDLLVQYPLSGDPAETVDLSVPDHFALWQIASLGTVKVRLLLCQDIPPSEVVDHNATDEQAAEEASVFIEKLTYAMVQEKKWWRLG